MDAVMNLAKKFVFNRLLFTHTGVVFFNILKVQM